jgi:hypothetical protein
LSHRLLFGAYSNPLRVVDSADFDGTNDYMRRVGGLTGAADSKTGILSVWVRFDGGDGAAQCVIMGASALAGAAIRGIGVYKNAGNRLSINGVSTAPGVNLEWISDTTYTAGASWLHILSSWDLATSTINVYVNDASVAPLSAPTIVDANLDYTNADTAVGANGDASQKLNGCLADLYFAPGQYLDISNVYNRRKFISASGKPVHLGLTGALPTGTAPLVYHHLDDAEAVASFATNRGTGGDFTITGTLATGSSSPSD